MKYISENSFIDFFILNELCKNVDAFRLSFFLYKDKLSKGGKLNAGPIWDYNLAFGNANYFDASLIQGWQLDYLTSDYNFLNTDPYQVPFWWKKLFSDPDFKNKAALRWMELRADKFSIAAINLIIDSLALLLNESQERNYDRWPILDEWVWPNPNEMVTANTFEKQVEYLKGWISRRFIWMDNEIASFLVDVKEENLTRISNFILYRNYPNPFNPPTKIKYAVLNTSNSVQHVILKVYDILGREVAFLVNEEKAAGEYEIEFDAKNLADGLYFYQLRAGSFSQTKKMVCLK